MPEKSYLGSERPKKEEDETRTRSGSTVDVHTSSPSVYRKRSLLKPPKTSVPIRSTTGD